MYTEKMKAADFVEAQRLVLLANQEQIEDWPNNDPTGLLTAVWPSRVATVTEQDEEVFGDLEIDTKWYEIECLGSGHNPIKFWIRAEYEKFWIEEDLDDVLGNS